MSQGVQFNTHALEAAIVRQGHRRNTEMKTRKAAGQSRITTPTYATLAAVSARFVAKKTPKGLTRTTGN